MILGEKLTPQSKKLELFFTVLRLFLFSSLNLWCVHAHTQDRMYECMSICMSMQDRQTHYIHIYIWGFPEIGVPPNHPFIDGFCMINHPFRGTPFMETSIYVYIHPCTFFVWSWQYWCEGFWVFAGARPGPQISWVLGQPLARHVTAAGNWAWHLSLLGVTCWTLQQGDRYAIFAGWNGKWY